MQDIISESSAWLELRVPESAVDEADFVQMCSRLGATGQALQTDVKSGLGEHVAWFATGPDLNEMRVRIAAAAMLLGVQGSDISLAELGDDWETAWQRDWHGMAIGESLWVRPSFCEPAPEKRIDIVLDPGMAFGTGQHATTQLCLVAIERLCKQTAPLNMLDMGAGSGLLAIAAGKLGAANILAIDNDPDAVAACEKNAEINGIQMQSRLGDSPPQQTFDLVAANILAGPLIDMAPQLAAATGGQLLLSGLLETQINDVRHAYEAAGLHFSGSDIQDEWAMLMFSGATAP